MCLTFLLEGFQLLHAVYAVEKFLGGLLQRKCNFHLAFFDCNNRVCIPPGARPENHAKYMLAREVIIQHLHDHLPKVQPSVELHIFESHLSHKFQVYLQTSGMYFMMVHDGAQARGQRPSDDAAMRDQQNQQKNNTRSSNSCCVS